MSDFSIGLSGLMGARRALDIIGQNITNASTPGYARREVIFSAIPGSINGDQAVGGGVNAETVVRLRDMFLQERSLDYHSSLSQTESQIPYFAEIEGILQEPGTNGISSILDQFFSQWQALATRPEDAAARIALLTTAQNLSERIATLREGLFSIRRAINLEICDTVDQVNSLTSQIADNNANTLFAADNNRPLGLEDERDSLLLQLCQLVGITNTSPNTPSANINVGPWLLVSGPDTVSLTPPEDYMGSVTVGGNPDAIFNCDSGKLAGLLQLNSEILPGYLQALDDFSVNLMRAVNSVYSEGIPSDGRFTDLVSANAMRDMDGDGSAMNELLSSGGLPFAPAAGALSINVADAAGNVTTHTIQINPGSQTLADVIGALDGIEHLSAAQVNGRIRIVADSGYSFDFAADQGTDFLAAVGMNAFFTGTDAGDMAVRSDLLNDSQKLAIGSSLDSGDGSIAGALARLRQSTVAGGLTPSGLWQQFVSEVALDSASATRSASTLNDMVTILDEQEQSVSGVNLDEEAAKLIQFQQTYNACARYLSTISSLTDTLLEYV